MIMLMRFFKYVVRNQILYCLHGLHPEPLELKFSHPLHNLPLTNHRLRDPRNCAQRLSASKHPHDLNTSAYQPVSFPTHELYEDE